MSDVQEQEVPADEQVPEEQQQEEFIEFVGWPPYGTEFYKAWNGNEGGTHTLNQKDFKAQHDTDLGKKEVVWRKDQNGRMLVPVSDLTPEAAKVLVNDAAFKKVTV